MAYRIELRPAAQKYIRKLPQNDQKRILDALEVLSTNPYAGGARPLTNGETEWRVRVGDWRILYDIHNDLLVVDVVRVVPRGQAYKQRR